MQLSPKNRIWYFMQNLHELLNSILWERKFSFSSVAANDLVFYAPFNPI